VSTQANAQATRPRRKPKIEAPAPAPALTPEDVRHYTPQEVVQLGLLRVSARWLKDSAYQRKIPHRKIGGRIQFSLEDIQAISASMAVAPVATGPGRAA
jgi:hypothetical protein